MERDSTFARTVDVTAGRLPLTELLRNIARASGVNLSVRSVENIPVSCNFTRTRVDDLVRFLCREYPGSTSRLRVISFRFSLRPAAPRPQPDPEIFYNAADTTLFYDLNGERLIDVTKKITTFSGRNIIVPQPLYDCKVSGYVRAMPFDGALQTLAAVNGWSPKKTLRRSGWSTANRRSSRRAAGPVRRMSAGGDFQKTNCTSIRSAASRPISPAAVQDITSTCAGSSA